MIGHIAANSMTKDIPSHAGTTYPYSFSPFSFPKLPTYPLGKDLPTFYPISIGDTCAAKTITSGTIGRSLKPKGARIKFCPGYAMGRVLGFMLSSYEAITPPILVDGQRELPKVPFREQVAAKHNY
jgi:hypothetical protein